jgi:hypothetical protein
MEVVRGVRIANVLAWNAAGPYSFDEAKYQVRRIVTERKILEKMNAYVEELKKSYTIAIKGE